MNTVLEKKESTINTKKAEQRNGANNGKRRIVIVDDHPIYREGLAQYINREKEYSVCGEFENANDALQAIRTLKPDLVIVDISLKDSNGIDLIKSMAAQYNRLPTLVLSMHDESLYAERVLQAGAQGYIMKEEAAKNVLTAIQRILEGKIYLSEAMTEKMLEKKVHGVPVDTSSIGALSDRELEVFQSIGKGLSTAKIAKNLHLSVKTVETYRANIKNKLSLKDNMELITHAVHWVQSGNKI